MTHTIIICCGLVVEAIFVVMLTHKSRTTKRLLLAVGLVASLTSAAAAELPHWLHHESHHTAANSDHLEQRVDRILDRYETRAHRVASRAPWDITGHLSDWASRRSETETLRDEDREYLENLREAVRQQTLYERERAYERQFGRSVLDTDIGIDIRQDIQVLSIDLDPEKVKEMLRQQEQAAKLRAKQREAQRAAEQADATRREQLIERGEQCHHCRWLPCRCPGPVQKPEQQEQLREPQKIVAPLRVPLRIEAEQVLTYQSRGIVAAKLRRLPPVREPQQDGKGKGNAISDPPPVDIDPLRSEGLREQP